MKKIFLFLAGLLIGLIVFMPKDNLYYTLQNYLKKEKIYINSNIKSGLSLKLKNGIVYYKGMDILKFKNINIFPFIYYNEINGQNIKLNMGDYRINTIKIIYIVFYPVRIFLKGESNFGKIKGYIDLIKREVRIYILNLTDKSLKRFLQKDKKGYFYYAKF
jgi:hypothetical protein